MTCGSTFLQGGNNAKPVEVEHPRTKEIPPFTDTTREQLFELKAKLLSDSTDPTTATRTSKQSFVAKVDSPEQVVKEGTKH
jgi:hypothetical protein